MKVFVLPDLGEGLPDAEINEWLVKEGDVVKVDQPLVSMETAKAVVEVPSPYSGKIEKLHGKKGDIIKTGSPLVEFEGSEEKEADKGTVVGHIESSGKTLEETSIVGGASGVSSVKATPAVRALAKRLNVDLSQVTPSAESGVITAADVERTVALLKEAGELELLRGARRTMATVMAKAHAEVVDVTIHDEADIHAWKEGSDITVRLVQALIVACQKEPALNAWYDTQAVGRRLHQSVNLGIATDTGEELLVPVIKHAEKKSASELREVIDRFKKLARTREIPAEELRGASITLSNFGTFAGRFANPVIVPPMVAILGVGKIRDAVVAFEGKPVIHRVVPLSLTFDHRAVTGGEATRFLGCFIEALQEKG